MALLAAVKEGINETMMTMMTTRQMQAIKIFIFAFCLHMCRFVARAVLWNAFAWLASSADLFSSTSVLSILASMTSTFSCLRASRRAAQRHELTLAKRCGEQRCQAAEAASPHRDVER